MYQKIYAYYKSRESGWVLLGTHVDRQIAMDRVQEAVAKEKLRCIFRWNDSDEYVCGTKESSVFGKLLDRPMEQGGMTVSEQRSYDLKRPAHLIAGQVIRDIEALQMVKYGPEHSAPIHRLVEQYQELLFQRDQEIANLMHHARTKGTE
jgi:hypothetical protein